MYWQDMISTTFESLINLPRLGIISDMDGTLSPIVDQPEAAQVTPRNQDLLKSLQTELPLVAIVSGRSVKDIQARINLANLVIIGNHGFEYKLDDKIEPLPAVAEYRPNLETCLHKLAKVVKPGMQIEDKAATLSVHYRQTVDPAGIATELLPIMKRVAAECNLALFEGRMVFEFRPKLQVNKGTALVHLIETFNLEAAIFMGDDTTDVDAMIAGRNLRQEGVCAVFSVGVAGEETPSSVLAEADCLAAGVAGVEDFLAWVLSARTAARLSSN
jgi:trehalose 6-phosphate phosphatase